MTIVTKVAIAVVESAGHVLVGTRPAGVPLAGRAEFPGGKCQSDETTRSCAVRECREETGLMVVPRRHLMTTSHEYEHGIVELDFWRCALSPDVADLCEPAKPFRWVPFRELRYLDFPEGNRKVLELLLEGTSKPRAVDDELQRMIDDITSAFAGAQRPVHFTDISHCSECAQHDKTLQAAGRDALQLSHVGTPGWDPINFVTDDAYRYLLPGLVRVMVQNPGQYFDRFLLHLRPDRLAAMPAVESRAVENFLNRYRERIARQTTSGQGEWNTILPKNGPSLPGGPMNEIDARLEEFRAVVRS